MNKKLLSESLSQPYPFDGEMFYPEKQKFNETIILTHHFGGHKKQMKRHIKFLNSLGFKAYSFNLFPQPFRSSFDLLKQPQFYYKKLSSIWLHQWKKTLSNIEGDKIIYSFSFSCNISSLMTYKDPTIKALIFDGGPFAEPFKSSWLYLSHQEIIKNPLLRAFVILPWILFFNFFFLKRRIHRALKKLKKGFPILSFQSLDDTLVPPLFTHSILKNHSHLNLTVATLKEVQHLQGLKVKPEIYQNFLKSFLINNATPV